MVLVIDSSAKDRLALSLSLTNVARPRVIMSAVGLEVTFWQRPRGVSVPPTDSVPLSSSFLTFPPLFARTVYTFVDPFNTVS